MSREICCSKCGVSVEAACDCGVPYISKLEFVAMYMDPTLSSRRNAKDFGVSKNTVLRAKDQLAQNGPVASDAEVTGLDGIKRPAKPKRNKKRDAESARARNKIIDKAYDFLTRFCHQITDNRWAKTLLPDERAELIKFLHTAANHFTLIAQELSELHTPPQTEEPSPWQINEPTSAKTGQSFH
jgi:transposase-like protein